MFKIRSVEFDMLNEQGSNISMINHKLDKLCELAESIVFYKKGDNIKINDHLDIKVLDVKMVYSETYGKEKTYLVEFPDEFKEVSGYKTKELTYLGIEYLKRSNQ